MVHTGGLRKYIWIAIPPNHLDFHQRILSLLKLVTKVTVWTRHEASDSHMKAPDPTFQIYI